MVKFTEEILDEKLHFLSNAEVRLFDCSIKIVTHMANLKNFSVNILLEGALEEFRGLQMSQR